MPVGVKGNQMFGHINILNNRQKVKYRKKFKGNKLETDKNADGLT